MKQKSIFRNVTFSLAKCAGVISAIICILLIAEEHNSARSKLDICNWEVRGWEACRNTNPSYFRANKDAASRSQEKLDDAQDNFWVKLPKAELAGLLVLGGLGGAAGGYLGTWAVLSLGGLVTHRFIRRKVRANKVRERPSVSSAKAAGRERNRQESRGLAKGRSAHVPEWRVRQEKPKETTERFKKLHEQIKQLQHEITKSGQTEAHLEQKIAKLMAVNERPQRGAAEHKRAEEDPGQQADARSVANEPFQRGREWPRKLCCKCREQKAESDFHKDRSCKDGLARWCKECKAKAAREYRKRQMAIKNGSMMTRD
jgi:hypothetical protein